MLSDALGAEKGVAHSTEPERQFAPHGVPVLSTNSLTSIQIIPNFYSMFFPLL